MLIENRAGAGGTVGASAASKAAPDGYTFLMGAAHHTIAPSLYPNLDYDIEKDFVAVALIRVRRRWSSSIPTRSPPRRSPSSSPTPRANPGKLNYGSAGAGTTHHLAGELFKILTKTNSSTSPIAGPGRRCRT